MIETQEIYAPFPEELEAARPPDNILISEWAGKNYHLGQDSAIKGLYKLDMAPHYAEIMDSCLNPVIRRISMSASAQSGKTTCCNVIVSFGIDQLAAPCLVTLEDQPTAEFIGEKRLKVVFEESERLSKLIDRNSWTKFSMNFKNGGFVEMGWASSVAKTGTRTIRILVSDEVDKPGWTLRTREASSLSRLDERADTHPNSIHLICSTVTDEFGNIMIELEGADAVFDRHIECPYCGLSQPLRWSGKFTHGFKEGKFRGKDGQLYNIGRVVWQGGREATKQQIKKTSRYECGECKELWTTTQKNKAVREAGEWVSREELSGFESHIHFHINRLISLFPGGRLETMVEKWVKIQKMKKGEKKRKELQGFINGSLAEPWVQIIKSVSELEILQARVPELNPGYYPETAVCLIAFVDVQKHGFFYGVRAFATDFSSWLVDYGQLGNYDDLEELLFERVYMLQGKNSTMKIFRAGLDVMGGIPREQDFTSTDEAELWVRANQGKGVQLCACRGAVRPFPGKIRRGKVLDKTPSGHEIPGGLMIYHINTLQCKISFLDRITNASKRNDFQPAYLHNEVGTDYAWQIQGEEIRFDEKKGIQYFHQIHANHYLDCEVGMLALADYSFPGGGVDRFVTQKQPQSTKKRPQNTRRHSKRFKGFNTNPWARR